MQTNVFLGGQTDPLLGGNSYATPSDYDSKIAELQQVQQRLEAQKRQISQPKEQGSPIWDEIEKITSELSDREFAHISESEEYKESQGHIMMILQREQMRIMRPIVERTTDGKQALERHLTLIKGLKKEATREIDKNIALFNEYTEHYSDMTYSEFLKMKKNKRKSK